MAIFKQVSETEIRADGKPIITELSKIESSIQQAKQAQAELTKGTKEYAALGKEVANLSAQADKVRESMGITSMTVSQLTKLQADLNKEWRQFGTGGEKLQEVNTRLHELRTEVASTHQTVKASEGVWTNLKGWIAGAFGVAAIIEGTRAVINFGKEVFDIGSKFEKYQVVLTKAMGSQEKANEAMSNLQKLASNTPFTLDELTKSYVKFVNRGVTPSMESMTKMGDVAASQGKSFDQLTEAILDAGTGEFERLKEFGIKAKKSGDEVELSFKGIQKTVKLTPEAMQGAIESFGELDTVAGMMATTMKTGEGQASNYQDKLDALKVMLYQGLTPVFKGLIGVGSQMLDGFISLVDWTKKLWNANQPLVEVISSLFRTVGNLVDIIWDTISATFKLNNSTAKAQEVLTGLRVVFGLVAAAAATLVGVIGLVIDGLRFLSGDISFSELKNNASKNFSEIGKSLKATFVDDPKKIKAEASKAHGDLAKGTSDAVTTETVKGQGERHKTVSEKEKKHREAEHGKAVKAAEDLAKDELEIRKKLADATDNVWFDSIDDQWEKKRLAIIREYEKDWETQKNLVGEKKELQEEFAKYEIQLAKNRDAALGKLADEKATAEEKARHDKQKAWEADLAKMEKEIDDFNKQEATAAKEKLKTDKDHARQVAEARKEMFQSLLGFVNDSFNDTIQTLEGIDSAYAQSQATRIKSVQAGFQQISAAVGSLKLDTAGIFDFVKGEGAASIGSQLGDNIAEGLGNAFTANPVKFLLAAKKIVDGINDVFEANRWAKFEAPLRKIIDDSLAAIDDMGKLLDIKMKGLEAEGDKLFNVNNANRDKLTAAALDYEAKQYAMLIKSQEDLNRINKEYAEEELRIKTLYADALNSQDAERAAQAREIVDGLIHDLQVSRNEELENLITTENAKRDIQKTADAELAELAKTANTRTVEEQAAIVAAVELKRNEDLAKLKDYEGQKAEINRLADEAALAAKTNANNLSIAEQQRLVDEIEAKRVQDLANLATSDLGILAIKQQTADAIKKIEEASAAETFRIESELKQKQAQAQWEHNVQVYAAQVAEWQAEKELTIAMLRLQMIKASGKIFNKAEMKAIEAALNAAIASLPPMPPSGLFNNPSSGSSGGGGASGGNPSGDGHKMEKGGYVGSQFFNNGGIAQGPRHRDGGIWMWNPETNQKVGELEGGEYIVNRRATAANLALISRINHSGLINKVSNSSFVRTGTPVYEDGGVFSTFGPITLNQSNSLADATFQMLEMIAKATDATSKAAENTAKAAAETASHSRNLGNIADATRATANKDFSPNISIIQQKLQQLSSIESSARL